MSTITRAAPTTRCSFLRRLGRAAAYVLRLLLAGGVVGAVILIGGLTKRGIDDYLHPGRTLPGRNPSAVGLAYKDIRLNTDDGLRLAAWYVPGSRADALILVHGLGANRGEMLDLAAQLHQRGYNLVLLDLRAHGESEGSVSTLGVKEVLDVKSAVQFLREQPTVDPHRIGIYGSSLGASVALIAAGELPQIRAVVADSTFASARWLAEHQLSSLVNLPDCFGSLLLTGGGLEAGINPDDVSPMTAAAHLDGRPLLLIHSADDGLFRLENAYLVYNAAGGPRDLWVVEGAGHSGAYGQDPVFYTNRIDAFFRSSM